MSGTKLHNRFLRKLQMTLVAGLASAATVSEAALLNLADGPLYLLTTVDPNIILTFDDSGSMSWGYLPDTISGLNNTKRGCSHTVNGAAYNPAITYDPPLGANGSALNATPTSFSAAYVDGFHPAAVATRNLASQYRYKWVMNSAGSTYSSVAACGTGTTADQAAFYYVYDTSLAGCTSSTTDEACYRLVTVSATSGPGGTDERQNFANWYSYYSTRSLAAKTAAGRAFARFGSNVRVAGQHLNNTTLNSGSTMRFTRTIAESTTNSGNIQKFCDDPSNTDPNCPDGSGARSQFFTQLYNSPASSGTPLRAAMERAGQYLSTNSSTNGAYRDNSTSSTSPERSCRQNFHVMMTDGYWNSDSETRGNVDGTAATLPDGTAYNIPTPPYSDTRPGTGDGNESTLADLAFYYWSRDLRDGSGGLANLTNNVPTRYTVTTGTAPAPYWNPVNDPANWQHMVTFTIGLGIDGTLPFNTTTYGNLVSGATSWPDPINNAAGERIDDLWHAAINSRGRYFSARNPNELVGAFTAIINDVADRISSASAAALNTSTLNTTTYVYQSRFNTDGWTGQLLAYYINPATATVNATPSWDSAVELNGLHYDTGRTIITYKPSNNHGIPFRWPTDPASPGAAELDVSQSTALNYNPTTATADTQGQARLNYLRGDASNEGGGNNYRPRNRICGTSTCPSGTNTGVLGDTINSAPVYVGKPPMLYPDNLESATPTAAQIYSNFRNTYANRTPIVYVGANDGMLHGFHANTGREMLAYVPSKVYDNLSQLTSTSYAHRYFVDGNPVPADVYVGGSWRTILVGGLRKGGQGIYALDVTNPTNFTETNADTISLWEFNDTHDADLGYTFSEPVVAKMHDGRWAVILGNGYNNDQADGNQGSGHAVLYILFIEDGMDGTWNEVIKIDTGVGSATIANGLAAPAAVDLDGDYLVDYIYAGDLRGNMWRFDVTSATPSNWSNAANRKVVYIAKDAANNLQPITSRPQIGPHPAGQAGQMVYFGTGKYLETGDASIVGATTQTFYGVWDESGIANPVRSNLLTQTVTNSTTVGGADYRIVSNNNMVWRIGPPYPNPSYIGWYLDLPTTGERTVTDSVLLGDRILFTTVIPSNDPCTAGGNGWLMELNAYTGGRLPTSPFDVNGDGTFSNLDLIPTGSGTQTGAASGKMFGGIPSAPTVLMGGNPASSPSCTGPKCKEQKLIGSSTGTLDSVANNPTECNYCRASWRQLR